MRLVCDENIKASITNLLVQEGHDALRVQDNFFDFDSHPGILFLAHQTTQARDVANAIRHIEQQFSADELADTVLHVPDGWV